MALAGTLKDFGLPDIVQLIGLQRKSGTLHLDTTGESVKVIFENGEIVAAESSMARPSDRIGSALVAQGALTKEQLDEALVIQKETMQRLGHVLISENIVTEETLSKAVEAQLFQVVFRLFRWKDASYNFETQNVVDYERTGAVKLGADFVLMEGIRMVDEWPIIERRIPSMASVFKRVVDSSQIQTKASAGGDDGLDGLLSNLGGPSGGGKLALSGDELLVFQAVDGKRTCQQIVEATPLHDFAVCRTLLDLMDRDVVALTDVKGSATREKAAGQNRAGVGFMAVAVLAALVVISLNLTSPFGLLGLPPLVRPAVDSALATRLRERLELTDERVRGFRLAYGRLPASLDEVVSEGLATQASVESMSFLPTPTGYRLEITGPGGPVSIERSLSGQAATLLAPPEAVPPGTAAPTATPTPKK